MSSSISVRLWSVKLQDLLGGWKYVQKASERGVEIGYVLYNIPLRQPQALKRDVELYHHPAIGKLNTIPIAMQSLRRSAVASARKARSSLPRQPRRYAHDAHDHGHHEPVNESFGVCHPPSNLPITAPILESYQLKRVTDFLRIAERILHIGCCDPRRVRAVQILSHEHGREAMVHAPHRFILRLKGYVGRQERFTYEGD